MNWQEVCEDVNLKDLPFKIELNERGQIIMSPMRYMHGIFQVKIATLLSQYLPQGHVSSECAIKTQKGTKVADVAWSSHKLFSKIRNEYDVSIAPEICVEIMSPSNTMEEMAFKMNLYFEQGAKEFWLCDEQGKMKFFDKGGELEQSKKVPGFPTEIES